MNTKLELISKKYIEETESIIKQKQKENLKAIEDKRKQISDKIDSVTTRIGDLEEMKGRGEKEISQKLNNFSGKINSLIRKPDSYKKKLEVEILPKYFDNSKYLELQKEKDLLGQELDTFELFAIQDNVIIFCENKNSEGS